MFLSNKHTESWHSPKLKNTSLIFQSLLNKLTLLPPNSDLYSCAIFPQCTLFVNDSKLYPLPNTAIFVFSPINMDSSVLGMWMYIMISQSWTQIILTVRAVFVHPSIPSFYPRDARCSPTPQPHQNCDNQKHSRTLVHLLQRNSAAAENHGSGVMRAPRPPGAHSLSDVTSSSQCTLGC